jgi:hypothetical protein
MKPNFIKNKLCYKIVVKKIILKNVLEHKLHKYYVFLLNFPPCAKL